MRWKAKAMTPLPNYPTQKPGQNKDTNNHAGVAGVHSLFDRDRKHLKIQTVAQDSGT